MEFASVNRVVVPELLDELPAEDPEARRSRRDLRVINLLMGNFRWVRRAVARQRAGRLVELGAGDGALLASLSAAGEGCELTGIDLQPRPAGLARAITWHRGDVFAALAEQPGGRTANAGTTIVANLFLHQFEDDRLRELGGLLRSCDVLCFSEPLRSRLALAEGRCLFPFVNRVTRHDMIVSIRAGFRRGELPALLGLRDADWDVREQETLLGACRLLACRRR